MKKCERMSSTPGFRYDGRTNTGFFDPTVPGVGRNVRQRKTVEAGSAWVCRG
jgi:hypothetical protein